MTEGRFFKDYSWQERAVDQLTEQLNIFYSAERGKFERAYVVKVSPSGGKTIFSMKAARSMIEAKLIDKVIWLVPRNSIKLGFADDCKHVPMAEDVRHLRREHMHVELDLKATYRGWLRNTHGAVVTYQALPGLMNYFQHLAEAGKRLMFVFDEAHHGAAGEIDDTDDATANVWGEAMQQVVAIAHAIICMTGTPVRADDKRVSLLQYEEQEVVNPVGGGMFRAYHVKADFTFGYADAVRAGVARKLIVRNQDPTMDFTWDGDHHSEKLSGVERRLLPHAKRLLVDGERGTVDAMLKQAWDESERNRRTGDMDAAVLVIVENTASGRRNPMDYVRERIRELFKEEPVTVEFADGQEAQDQIKAFKRSGNTTRWIVAKNMISEGTNIPRIRVVCILRDIKSSVFYEQLVHRATRNDSDEVPQDAIVIQWHLPTLYAYGYTIEQETNMIVPTPKPRCPECNVELEFRPRQDHPCPNCGYEPEGGSESNTSSIDFVGIAARLDDEEVTQGGENFSKWDPLGRKILDQLGPNPRYGGRDGINEVLRLADIHNLMKVPEAQPQRPVFSVDEEMDRYWHLGNENCRKAAGIIQRLRRMPYNELREIIAVCKREAGMGRDKIENVRRDDPDALAKIKSFHSASNNALVRASRMAGGGGVGGRAA